MQKLFLILLLTCLAYIPNSSAGEFESLVKKGDEYYKNLDNQDAVKYYESAYKLAPNNFEVLKKLTRTLNDAGEEQFILRNRELAQDYINRAVNLAETFKKEFPDSAIVYSYIAFCYGNLAMFKGGKEKIKLANIIKDNAEKSIEMDSSNYLPYIILGIYNREVASLSWFEKLFANTFFGSLPEGSYDQSLKMFRKALSFNPNMIVANFQMSRTYRKLEMYDKEKALLQKVINLPVVNFRDKFAKIRAQRRLTQMEKE